MAIEMRDKGRAAVQGEVSSEADALRVMGIPYVETRLDRASGQGATIGPYSFRVASITEKEISLKLQVSGISGSEMVKLSLGEKAELVPGCFVSFDGSYRKASPGQNGKRDRIAVITISRPGDMEMVRSEYVKYQKALENAGLAGFLGIPTEVAFLHDGSHVNLKAVRAMHVDRVIDFDEKAQLLFKGEPFQIESSLDAFIASYNSYKNRDLPFRG